MNISDRDLLKYATEHGMIDMSIICEQIEMLKKKEILAQHPYSIWIGKDGRWRTYINDSGKRTLKTSSSEAGIHKILFQYYSKLEEEKKRDYTFKSFFEYWKQTQIEYGISNNTLSKYNSDYIRYFDNTDFEKLDIRRINEETITIFIVNRIRTLNLKEKAGKSLWGYISGVFKHARILRVIEENPCEYVETRTFSKFYDRSKKSDEERVINQNDMRSLLNEIYMSYQKKPYYIQCYAVELAIYTGMRVGELAALKWEDVREDIGVIIIRNSEKYDRIKKEYIISSTKTGKERQFPISDKISKVLASVKKVEIKYGFIGEYVFQNAGGRVHARSISHCMRHKCTQAGIPEKSIHAIRRTLNSKLRCAGVSATVASALLGHTEEVNSSNYTYDISGMDYKREVISKIEHIF